MLRSVLAGARCAATPAASVGQAASVQPGSKPCRRMHVLVDDACEAQTNSALTRAHQSEQANQQQRLQKVMIECITRAVPLCASCSNVYQAAPSAQHSLRHHETDPLHTRQQAWQ